MIANASCWVDVLDVESVDGQCNTKRRLTAQAVRRGWNATEGPGFHILGFRRSQSADQTHLDSSRETESRNPLRAGGDGQGQTLGSANTASLQAACEWLLCNYCVLECV